MVATKPRGSLWEALRPKQARPRDGLISPILPAIISLTFEVGGSPTFFVRFESEPLTGSFPVNASRSQMVKLDQHISEIIERVTTREGLELVHAELTGGRNPILRIYIDKSGGVTIEDCAAVSERLSLILDVEDPIPGQYTLEVASPGLDRGLYKEADYERFAGLPCHVKTAEAINGQRNFHGKLLGLEREGVVAAIIVEPDGKQHRLPLTAIVKANVEIEP